MQTNLLTEIMNTSLNMNGKVRHLRLCPSSVDVCCNSYLQFVLFIVHAYNKVVALNINSARANMMNMLKQVTLKNTFSIKCI